MNKGLAHKKAQKISCQKQYSDTSSGSSCQQAPTSQSQSGDSKALLELRTRFYWGFCCQPRTQLQASHVLQSTCCHWQLARSMLARSCLQAAGSAAPPTCAGFQTYPGHLAGCCRRAGIKQAISGLRADMQTALHSSHCPHATTPPRSLPSLALWQSRRHQQLAQRCSFSQRRARGQNCSPAPRRCTFVCPAVDSEADAAPGEVLAGA